MPEEHLNEWTVETLFIHLSRIVADLEHRIDDQTLSVERTASSAVISSERAIQAALAASEKAIAKAELSTEKRYDAMAESVEQRLNGIDAKTDANTTRIERSEAKGMGLAQGWGWLVGAIGLLLALYSFFSHFNAPVPAQAAPVYLSQPPAAAK